MTKTGLVVPTVIVMVVLYVNIQDGNLCVLISVSQKTSLSDGILLRPATIRHLSGVFFATHSCHDGVDRRPERTN